MHTRPRKALIAPLSTLLLLSLTALAGADEIKLTGGSTIEGIVLERGASDVVIQIPGGDVLKVEGKETVRVLLPHGDELQLHATDVASITPSPGAPSAGQYLGYRPPTKESAGGLEVALMHFVHPDGGPRVDLISAVHIADASYFREVQRLLEASDVVLYEGVKARDATAADFVKDQGEGANPVRALQQNLAKWFDLRFQLTEIVYTRPHFVHADMVAEDLLPRSSANKPATTPGTSEKPGEGPQPPAGMPGMPQNAEGLMKMLESYGPMLEQMLGRPGPMRDRLKRQLAQMLGTADVGAMLGTVLPKGLTDLLIDKRNDVVMERLAEQREKLGNQKRANIAVFYGAGHMKDLEQRLRELGYTRAGGRWLRAWEVN
jgi:hypothetical protein